MGRVVIVWTVTGIDHTDRTVTRFDGQRENTRYRVEYVDGHWSITTTVIGVFQTFPDKTYEVFSSWLELVNASPLVADLYELMNVQCVDTC